MLTNIKENLPNIGTLNVENIYEGGTIEVRDRGLCRTYSSIVDGRCTKREKNLDRKNAKRRSRNRWMYNVINDQKGLEVRAWDEKMKNRND